MTNQQAKSNSMKARLEGLRASIVQRKQALNKYLHHREAPLPADFAEQAVELENDEARVAIERELNIELREVDAALARMEAGDYGICSHCEEPINESRLSTLPQATLCVDCASEVEAQEQTV